MAGPRVPDDYLPWFLAHDCNFAPFETTMSESEDLGGDEFMILLATKEESVNVLFIVDQAWE